MEYNPEIWIELAKVIIAGILAIIAALNAGKIADKASNTFDKVIELVKAWRKK